MSLLLSIVTGTFNRRAHLAGFVQSIRANIPHGLPYEIILVDGGSTDGTLDWCRQQPDVVLIEQGQLFGAIKAFDAGAYTAQGDYVLLGNDDVTLQLNSLMPAILHLETHPTCGGVAFKDNRPAPGYPPRVYKVQTFNVRDIDGSEKSVPYAQVGLFRRWLGERCLWWGSRDEVMQHGHTYGGDNYLSARMYEHGYTIDVVNECQVDDHTAEDDLRATNDRAEKKRPGVYYSRYKAAPQFVQPPALPNPQTERLRVLYLPIYEPHEPAQQLHKRGLREALQRVGLVWEVDYVNQRYDLVEIVNRWQPHLLLMQAHSASAIPLDKLIAAREARPEMVVINWNGDVYEDLLTNSAMLTYLRHVDLQLTVNDSVRKVYDQYGIASAYWQVSYEPVDYDALPEVPRHDVVFLANCRTDWRRLLGQTLQSMSGINVGVYGRGWKWANGDCTYNFPIGCALYQNAQIAIGDNEFQEQYGFVSNRIFEALASGVFLLHQTVKGLEALTGLQDGVHYVAWTDVEDLQRKIRHWLEPRHLEHRGRILREGRDYVRANHNFDRRIQELLGLLERVGERSIA